MRLGVSVNKHKESIKIQSKLKVSRNYMRAGLMTYSDIVSVH